MLELECKASCGCKTTSWDTPPGLSAWRVCTIHGQELCQGDMRCPAEGRALATTSVQFSHSVMSTLYDPMGGSMPGFPVHHQLPELAQTPVHQVGDTVQPSHPLSSPSLPAFSLSQHQGLFQGVSSSHQVAKVLGVSASASVLSMNIQD